MSTPSDSQTSLTLLKRLQHDPADSRAWDEFVRRYRPKILGWCRDWGLQSADAEDVAQVVLAKVSEGIRRFRYDPSGSFRAWLKTVARHAWADLAARWHREVGSGDDRALRELQSFEARVDLERGLEEAFDGELLELAILRVRQRVAPLTWSAFELTAIERLAGAEAARRLAMPVAHVFVAKHRVQKMLQAEVRDLEGGETS